jgi:hypothetical protein
LTGMISGACHRVATLKPIIGEVSGGFRDVCVSVGKAQEGDRWRFVEWQVVLMSRMRRDICRMRTVLIKFKD